MVYLKRDNQVAEINVEKIALSLINNGFVEMTESEVEKYLKDKEQKENYKLNPILSYEDKIVSLIRQKYSINQELAILRQRDTKPEEYAEYNEYVEQCKLQAKELCNINKGEIKDVTKL